MQQNTIQFYHGLNNAALVDLDYQINSIHLIHFVAAQSATG